MGGAGDAHVETEVKLRVSDVGEARQRLASLDATLLRERHLEDNVLLDDPSRSLASRGRILRVRRTPSGGLLTFKAPLASSDGVKSRQETELTVSDPDSLEAILLELGLEHAFRYQKYREVYSLPGLEVALDETPIGVFLELEGEAARIHEWAARLGFGASDYIVESYIELFLASGGSGDMLFPPP